MTKKRVLLRRVMLQTTKANPHTDEDEEANDVETPREPGAAQRVFLEDICANIPEDTSKDIDEIDLSLQKLIDKIKEVAAFRNEDRFSSWIHGNSVQAALNTLDAAVRRSISRIELTIIVDPGRRFSMKRPAEYGALFACEGDFHREKLSTPRSKYGFKQRFRHSATRTELPIL